MSLFLAGTKLAQALNPNKYIANPKALQMLIFMTAAGGGVRIVHYTRDGGDVC
ncbi:MAG: hypothetical protein LBG66_04850 [Gallionellaceae bacterium]|nr:hypothetical protein [Gallionellaceae bacterium]